MSGAVKRACLGAFAGAHGVKGEAKVKSFTEEPKSIAAYGPVETEDGERQFTLSVVRALKPDLLLVRAPEIQSREDAERLKGARLYVNREKLPPPDEDEFYLDDLIGLAAVDENARSLGVVNAVYNFGAGEIIELKDIPEVKGMRLVPFTKEDIPDVDIAAGKITVRRGAIPFDDEANPGVSQTYVDAAMRQEDA